MADLNRKIFIHAPNIHTGGGAVLLRALLKVLPVGAHVTVDERFGEIDVGNTSLEVLRVKPNILRRLLAEHVLKGLVKVEGLVICFGNLPPLFASKGKVVLFLQNRYLLDHNISLSGFSFKIRCRIAMERLWIALFLSHVDMVVVQTPSMARLFKQRFRREAVVMPFVEEGALPVQGEKREAEYDFVYVASGEPHKNHRNLIDAWSLLAEQGLRPSLCLTLDEDKFPELVAYIGEKSKANGLHVVNKGASTPSADLYRNAKALIYPSIFESFGLPLIEAGEAGLPIVASELDYVRDLIEPRESFDPQSPVSIARAVQRFTGAHQNPVKLLGADAFLEHLASGETLH